MTEQQQRVHDATACWVERFVIGLDLCPFAARPWQQGSVRIAVADATDATAFLHLFVEELQRLLHSDEATLSTTLLVASAGLEDFDGYLDIAELAQQLIEQYELEGILQIATFHPQYQFEAEAAEGLSHYTNRSPYPMLHLIREAQMEQALDHYPDPENIPSRNIARLEAIGLDGICSLLEACETRS